MILSLFSERFFQSIDLFVQLRYLLGFLLQLLSQPIYFLGHYYTIGCVERYVVRLKLLCCRDLLGLSVIV